MKTLILKDGKYELAPGAFKNVVAAPFKPIMNQPMSGHEGLISAAFYFFIGGITGATAFNTFFKKTATVLDKSRQAFTEATSDEDYS